MQYPITCKIEENEEFYYVGYIADFIINDTIYEIDGGYHNTKQQKCRDKIRDSRLRKMGYHIVRYSNEEVMKMYYNNFRERENGYTIIQDKMVEELGVLDSYILSRLIRWKNYIGNNDFQVSDSVLMKECNISKSTFRRHRDILKKLGYLNYKNKKNEDSTNQPCSYQLNYDKINSFLK